MQVFVIINKDGLMIKCRCECKELIDQETCDKGFIWNPSNCECDKLCDVGKYLDYRNCKCRKRLTEKLVEECNENIDENEMIDVTLNDHKNVSGSCTIYIYIVLSAVFFIISISIRSVFIYFHWYLKMSKTAVTNINPSTETVMY